MPLFYNLCFEIKVGDLKKELNNVVYPSEINADL